MNISKSVAQSMNNVGIVGSIVAILYSLSPTYKIAELESTPQYQGARRIEEITEETEERLEDINDCSETHRVNPDGCLAAVTSFFEYVDATHEENEQLTTSFPHHQEAWDEMESLRKHMLGAGIGLIAFGSLTVAGNFAYRRREREEKAQHQKVSKLYPK